MKRQYLLLLSSLFLLKANGQEQTKAYNLKEAISYALEHNVEVENAKTDIEIANKKVWETTAIGLPQVSAEVGMQHFLDIPTQLLPDFISPTVLQTLVQYQVLNPEDISFGEPQFVEAKFGTDFTASAGVTANQLLFNGSYLVGLKAAKAYKSVSEKSLVKTELELKDKVAMAFNSVLVTQENIRVLEAMLEQVKQLHKETRMIFEQGLIEEQDADQVELNVMSLENALKSAQRQKELAMLVLKMQMGMDLQADIETSAKLEEAVKFEDMEALLAKAYAPTSNIDYQLVESQQSLNELALKNEKAAYLPVAAAFINHQQQAMRNEFNFFSNGDWFPSTVWGINISIPIFSSGMKNAKVKQAALELQKTTNQLELVKNGLELEVAQAKLTYLSAKETMEAEKDNMELADKIYHTTLKKQQQGLASTMDLSQAQTQFLTVQSQYILALYEVLNAKTKLDKIYNNY